MIAYSERVLSSWKYIIYVCVRDFQAIVSFLVFIALASILMYGSST